MGFLASNKGGLHISRHHDDGPEYNGYLRDMGSRRCSLATHRFSVSNTIALTGTTGAARQGRLSCQLAGTNNNHPNPAFSQFYKRVCHSI